MEQMYNAGEEVMNILGFVDYEKMFRVIKFFPELNQNFVKEGIILPLSSSSRAIEW